MDWKTVYKKLLLRRHHVEMFERLTMSFQRSLRQDLAQKLRA
jgi:hypothetical protein